MVYFKANYFFKVPDGVQHFQGLGLGPYANFYRNI